MASLKVIRKRITSVRNTQQITKAMKMVSAAKLRRAQETVERARPYADKMAALLNNLSARLPSESHPLLKGREEKRVDLFLLTSDRGLCGGYNATLIRAAEEFIRTRISTGGVNLLIVGRKGADYFRRRNADIAERYLNIGAIRLEDLAVQLAEKALDRFLKGESDGTYLLYGRFQSAISQVPTVAKLLPVATGDKPEEDKAVEYLIEPSAESLLSSLLPKVVEVVIYRALLEAAASEHGARMTAMDSATNNAREMINHLTLQMNRARQAAITNELLEVVSTAEALK